MTAIDRRSLLKYLGGAAVATVGLSLMPSVAEATPLSSGMAGVGKTEETESLIEDARTVVVSSRHPHRRRHHHRHHRRHHHRRRRVCYWRRGRRVCVWR
jgi:hypothetical protein